MTQTADSAELRKLNRAQIQSLAKREGIRANAKTEEIIHRLTQKHPGGVPMLEDSSNPSTSSRPPQPDPSSETTHVMDKAMLSELPRARLQSLAKREGVRAVGKTVDIIDRLLNQHPGGVPVPDDYLSSDTPTEPNFRGATNRRASLSRPEPIILKIPHTTMSTLLTAPKTSPKPTDLKGKGKQVVEVTSPASPNVSDDLVYPYDETEADSPNTHAPEVAVPHVLPEHPGTPYDETPPPKRPSNPQLRSPELSVPGQRADEEVYDHLDYPKGAPNHYMVVDALRQFTALVDTIPSMETRLAESRCLLRRAEAMLDKAIPDARELVVTREYLETFMLGKMKQKRELWDGTAKMNKKDRKLRTEWLKAERKAEGERRWREANELYRKHGLEAESLSAFISESDEEVVTSLQTTPTSSRDGGSKRSREGSVDGESEEDAASDEGRKKRVRL